MTRQEREAKLQADNPTICGACAVLSRRYETYGIACPLHAAPKTQGA